MNTDKPTSGLGHGITFLMVALSITIGMSQTAADASSKDRSRHQAIPKSAKVALKIATKEKIAANEKDAKADNEKDKDKKDAKIDKDVKSDKGKAKEEKKAAEDKAKADAKAAKKDAKESKDAKDEKAEGKGFFKGIFGKEEVGKNAAAKDSKPETSPAASKSPASGDDAASGAAAATPPAVPPAPASTPAPAAAKPAAQAATDSATGAEPKYIPDAALISILKDISKSLADNDDIKNIEDPAQKVAIKLAADTLSKALADPDLGTNRIIAAEDRPRVETRLVAETWDSQLLQLGPNCTASLSTLWAKRANGLVNISIAGTCGCKAVPGGSETKIGEWIVVLTGKSSIDKGFDIQTQQEVPFWLGKLSGFTVEATICSQEAQETGKKPQSPALVLKSVLTERGRKHLEAVTAWQSAQKLAILQAEQERTRTEEEAKLAAEVKAKEQDRLSMEAKIAAEKERVENEVRAKLAAEAALKAVAEQKAKELAEAEARAKMDEKMKAEAAAAAAEARAKAEEEAKAKLEAEAKAKVEAEAKAKAEADAKAKAEAEAKAETEARAKAEAKAKEEAEAKAKAEEDAAKAKVAATTPSTNYNYGSRTWDSPAPVQASRLPKSGSGKTTLLVPDRAVAGQYVTAAAVNESNVGESYVELAFNGAALTTANDGTVHYMVPEDSAPGPTMVVTLPGNPLDAPKSMEVLQPLMVPATQQVPRIDKANPMVAAGEVLTIDGHSFDGVGDNNRVIVDGAGDAKVLAASPVQLKVELPHGIAAGRHSISISTAGLRSNPIFVDVVSVRIDTLGKDDLKRIKVCVLGTQNKVTLKLTNRSPEVVKLAKGDEQFVTTAGGTDNCAMVTAQRVGKGAVNINARVEPPTAVSRAY